MEWDYSDIASNVEDTITTLKQYIDTLSTVELSPGMSEQAFTDLLHIQNEYYTVSSNLDVTCHYACQRTSTIMRRAVTNHSLTPCPWKQRKNYAHFTLA